MATITVKAKPTTAEEKLEELFRQNSKLIYNAAFRITGNADDAEDVLQTIILRLMGRELSDELLAKPKGYWWQAAVNEALSIVESRKRWTTEPIFVKDEDRNQRESDDVARKTAALHHEADAQRRLMDAIARLEPDDVGLLLLYREGYDDREIAEIRGEREGTVSSKLSRARKKLKQLMMEDAS